MIECEGCQDWFHGQCVGILESQSDNLVDWHCPKCRAPAPQPHPPKNEPSSQHASTAMQVGAAGAAGVSCEHSSNNGFTLSSVQSTYVPMHAAVNGEPKASDLSLLLNFAGGGSV